MMQHLELDRYRWHIAVCYTVSKDEEDEILRMLGGAGDEALDRVRRSLSRRETDTGFTYSDFAERFTVMVIHRASSIGEFINTLEHEKNHLEMHICESLDINPYSEEAAHLSGDIAQLMLEKALGSITSL